MALTLSKCSTSSSPSCSFSQKTFSTFGSGHHLRQVTVLTIIRNVPGSWSGVTLGMKMQMITFSSRSSETYSKEQYIYDTLPEQEGNKLCDLVLESVSRNEAQIKKSSIEADFNIANSINIKWGSNKDISLSHRMGKSTHF